ncbi:MAG: hypothetical protein K1X64_07895 [Myxococcaceae bacterium]|nr:hypothetical protein [Myxococcaceae bacterium]
MAGPILLVHDDLATIATARRLLGREGYEVVLASSAADAVIAFGHHLPSLVVLAPAVEGDRGQIALEEIQQHPDGPLARVLLLGESIPGFGYPIAPLPLEPDTFIAQVNELVRSSSSPAEAEKWQMVENAERASTPRVVSTRLSDDWRTQAPPDITLRIAGDTAEMPVANELEGRLFGDLPSLEEEVHREVEAQAMAHVDSAMAAAVQPAPPPSSPPRTFDAGPAFEAVERAQAIADKARVEKEAADSAAEAALKRLEGVNEQLAQLDTQVELRTAENLKLEAQLAAQKAEFAVKLKSAKDDFEERLRSEKDAAARGTEAQWKTRFDDEGAKASERVTRLEEKLSGLEETLAGLRDASATLQTQLNERTEWAALLERELAGMKERAEKAEGQLADERADGQNLRQNLDEALTSWTQSGAREKEWQRAFDETKRTAAEGEQVLQQQLAQEREQKAQALAERDALAEQVATLQLNVAQQGQHIATLTDSLAKLEHDLQDARQERGVLQQKAEVAKLAAEGAERKLRDLETKTVLPLAPPGRPALGVPRFGEVDLSGLARLMLELSQARVDVKVEWVVAEGKRTLWFQRGQLIAAESTFPLETLIHRARRDGLLDGRQEAELRILHTAAPAEALNVLKSRGFVRELEVVPLVQRYTEQLALEAFSELRSSYRLADEVPGNDVLVAASPRATLPLLTEALRRALSVDEVLESLGGSQAIPVPLDSELDARTLGFSDRERRLLTLVDGQATVEEIALASGLRQEVAFKGLLVGRLLGLFDIKAPVAKAPAISPSLDAQRLEAKYEEIQEADYFSILGLTRTAGSDEVHRAFERLSTEFDPIRFSGHPDIAVQQRAQMVHAMLSEAAKALEDDRRRLEYARHLLD